MTTQGLPSQAISVPDLVTQLFETRLRRKSGTPPVSVGASEVMFEGVWRKKGSTTHGFGSEEQGRFPSC